MNPEHVRLRDRWLEEQCRGLLRHDERLRGIHVRIRFNGGVAHVEGQVADQEERRRLREAVCALRGVHAFWDGLRVAGQGQLRTLDVGAGGTRQRARSLGLDRYPGAGVDLLADLHDGLPLADRGVDRLYAVHVLEHLSDPVAVMNEMHRVLADDGVLHVLSPHWKSIGAVADPTHMRFLDVQTFKWFCVPRPGARTWYPLHASSDGPSVFADLAPVRAGRAADVARLARYFD
jgi:SAM-dependent methyltransferase